MAFTHIDCFSGPGGFCTGLHAAGFDTRVAIEYIKTCVETYSKNHPNVHVIHNDIRKVTEEDILPYIPEDGIDLITSGMPCETFSSAGSTSRSFYDDRQVLFREAIRIAVFTKAKMILFENVPEIRTKTITEDSDELVVDILKRELETAGYKNFMETVLASDDFGVPQARNRYFILACRNGWALTEPTPSSSQNHKTVRDAFIDLPDVTANSGVDGTAYRECNSDYSLLMKNDSFWKREGLFEPALDDHHPMNHKLSTIKRFSLIEPGENLATLFEKYDSSTIEKYKQEKILPKKPFAGRCYRLLLDKPSRTVTSHCLEEFVHPTSNRALTVRECARLQSFPDSYRFSGPYSVGHDNRDVQDRYEQIGDAVPPLLAYAWGLTIKEILENNHE